ncbi:MAG: hypothetical protein JNK32_14120, partial [Anaerolineales bacterium]|nr:hypothetical protein [Anaerolineales bacterium]
AKDLLEEIYYSVPEALQIEGDTYTYLALTATPLPPTPYGGFPTETPPATLEPVSTPQPLPTPTPSPEEAPSTPEAAAPLCGSAAILPALLGMMVIFNRRKFL